MSRANTVCSRRVFLAAAIPGVCAAAATKGTVLPSSVSRYADPTTEFPVFRLTDPQFTSVMPPHNARGLSRRGNFLLYASDASGSVQAHRLDLKSGQSRLLTEAESLDPACLALSADERTFCYVDAGRLYSSGVSSLRPRLVYRAPEGYQPTGMNLTEDGLFAALVEKKGVHHRLQLVRMMDGAATTLVEADEEIQDPSPRPRRASVAYRRAGGVWLANMIGTQNAGRQNYRLRLADGQTAAATWSPDGRAILYLHVPADPRKLRNIREFTPDTNEDKAVSDTTQYACFQRNADGSVFVGASGSKASPHVLLLVRAVHREFTLCEHRASDPSMVSPVFSPNSQNVFFSSDQHGKPAIYRIALDRLVEETEESPAASDRK